jgi:hypothetical protein
MFAGRLTAVTPLGANPHLVWLGVNRISMIRFIHISDFARVAKGDAGVMFDAVFGPFLELVRRAGAHWVATIKTEACARDRALEIANLSVDIGLAGLQLVCSLDDAQRINRLTGRAMPVLRYTVFRSDGQLSASTTNSGPVLASGPDVLDNLLQQAQPVLASIGKRVENYVRQTGCLARLDQAWSDASYWYHEGLAEPLDTIAVSKLETAIEVLLCSESTKGSKARLLSAIHAFYGKLSNELINPHSPVTVDQFVQEGLCRCPRLLKI